MRTSRSRPWRAVRRLGSLCWLALPWAAAIPSTALAAAQGPAVDSLIDARKARLSGYPYVYYTPETEAAIGMGGIVTFYTSKTDRILRPSKVTVSAYYSTRKQYKVSLTPQVYLRRNQWLARAPLSYGLYVDKFWGLGGDAPEIEHEDYKVEGFDALLAVEWPTFILPFALRAGFMYELNKSVIIDQLDNPNLTSGEVTGSAGGWTSGIGANLVWDDRDHTFFPNRGGLQEVRSLFYFPGIGSDFGFTSWTVDLRRYLALQPDHVIALQLFGSFVTGDPPFYQYPALGGQNLMRGYFTGRYRDKTYVAGQIEYRQYFWRRLGFVAFAGVGDVAPALGDFALGDFKYSLGFGLRFKFNRAEKVNLRADIGFGRGTNGVYFGLEEAF